MHFNEIFSINERFDYKILYAHVQRRNGFAVRSTEERTEVPAAQTKSAISAKVLAPASSKAKLKTAKVYYVAKFLSSFMSILILSIFVY